MIIIENIFWKRTYLFIEYVADSPVTLYIDNGTEIIYLETKRIDRSKYRSKLNICVQDERKMLSAGRWRISIGNSNSYDIDEALLSSLEAACAVFRYDENKAYIVTFHFDDKAGLYFKVDYMKKNPFPKVRLNLLFFPKLALNILYKLVRFFSLKKGNRILFLSENRNVMTGNLKAIHDRIVERGLGNNYIIDCIFEDIVSKRTSFSYWIRTIFHIAKSDYIFVEDYVPVFSFLNLDKKTCLVQTWHAGFGYKSVGYGRFGLEGSPHPYHSCHRKYTYALVGNEHLKEVYTEVFGIPEKDLLATGMPRLDKLLDMKHRNAKIKEFYDEHPLLCNKKTIIFAPTYRGSNQKEAYYDFDRINQKGLYEYCKENNAVVIFKFHHFITAPFEIAPEYAEYLMDMSEYDLHKLFYVSDLLITDYSSCFYDYILLDKPVIFYLYDESKFTASRGVHRNVSKTVPGLVVKSFEELIKALENNVYKNESNDVLEFMIDKCKTNGKYTASDRVIDFVLLDKEVDDIC